MMVKCILFLRYIIKDKWPIFYEDDGSIFIVP
jgi:hypothetical protein